MDICPGRDDAQPHLAARRGGDLFCEMCQSVVGEARDDTRGATLVERCPGRVKGSHQQASDDMLKTLNANEDSNLCVWCLQYDVCSDD